MSSVTRGPVDLILVEFDGQVPVPAISGALATITNSEVLRLLDLLIVSKDAGSAVSVVEMEELDSTQGPFSLLEPGLLTHEDILDFTLEMPPASAALILAVEQVWAQDLTDRLEAAGGVAVTETRIPADVVTTVLSA